VDLIEKLYKSRIFFIEPVSLVVVDQKRNVFHGDARDLRALAGLVRGHEDDGFVAEEADPCAVTKAPNSFCAIVNATPLNSAAGVRTPPVAILFRRCGSQASVGNVVRPRGDHRRILGVALPQRFKRAVPAGRGSPRRGVLDRGALAAAEDDKDDHEEAKEPPEDSETHNLLRIVRIDGGWIPGE
jgi:hypothetical protein